MTADTDRVASPVEVTVKNWPDPPASLPLIGNTNPRTYIVTTDNSFDGSAPQIANYEPKRSRMLVIPLDAAVSIADHQPNTAVGTSSASSKTGVEGAVLPVSNAGYEFFGPDAFWLQNLGTNTRVTVVKEYYGVRKTQ